MRQKDTNWVYSQFGKSNLKIGENLFLLECVYSSKSTSVLSTNIITILFVSWQENGSQARSFIRGNIRLYGVRQPSANRYCKLLGFYQRTKKLKSDFSAVQLQTIQKRRFFYVFCQCRLPFWIKQLTTFCDSLVCLCVFGGAFLYSGRTCVDQTPFPDPKKQFSVTLFQNKL